MGGGTQMRRGGGGWRALREEVLTGGSLFLLAFLSERSRPIGGETEALDKSE